MSACSLSRSACAASATAERASSSASRWWPRSARILADNPWPTAWADRSSSGGGFPAYREQVEGFVVPALALGRDGPGQLRRGGGQVAPLAHPVQEPYSRRRCVSAVAGSPASMATSAAGWVTAAVTVGPRASSSALRAAQRGVCRRDVVLHRVQARQVAEDDRPARRAGCRSRRGTPRIAESLPAAGVGPQSAAEASQLSISASSLRSFTRRAYSAARCQASSAAADLAWFQCSAASSCRVRQMPSSSWLRSNSRRSSGSARVISVAASCGSSSRPSSRACTRAWACWPSSPSAAAMRWAWSRVVLAFSSCPASASAAPRLV